MFTHSSNSQYGWQAIPVDPVTGKREWRNNKVLFFKGTGSRFSMQFQISASFNGFTMDETVKDEEPTAEEPEPQFSINDLDIKVGLGMRSSFQIFLGLS